MNIKTNKKIHFAVTVKASVASGAPKTIKKSGM